MHYRHIHKARWLHGFIIVPDGRVLVERLNFQTGCESKWCGSIGIQAFNDKSDETILHDSIERRFGVALEPSTAETTLLMTHSLPRDRHNTNVILRIPNTLKIFKVKILKSISLVLGKTSETMALPFPALVNDMVRGNYEDMTRDAVNIVHGMNIDLNV